MNFDKKDFAFLLSKARGSRSRNKYAEECGISSAHISRLLREKIDTPPSPETIQKFSSVAHNGITYEDLMIAAGYIERSFTPNSIALLRGDRTYDEYARHLKEKGVVEINSLMLEAYEKGLQKIDETIMKHIFEIETSVFDSYSEASLSKGITTGNNSSSKNDLPFLDTEIAMWVRDPENAEYLKFIHNVYKKGITKELLSRAQLVIAFEK